MRLILVRHGETATDDPEKCHGSTDIDLSAKGYLEAELLKDRFASLKIDAFYSSTLIRGYNTASIIADGHSIEIVKCPELNEVNFGLIECITYGQACDKFPAVASLWKQGSIELCFPEGESFFEFDARVKQFMERLKNHNDLETIMIVGHGGPFRLLICRLMDLPVKHYWQFRVSMASVTILNLYEHGAMLECLNDTSHLLLNEVKA